MHYCVRGRGPKYIYTSNHLTVLQSTWRPSTVSRSLAHTQPRALCHCLRAQGALQQYKQYIVGRLYLGKTDLILGKFKVGTSNFTFRKWVGTGVGAQFTKYESYETKCEICGAALNLLISKDQVQGSALSPVVSCSTKLIPCL